MSGLNLPAPINVQDDGFSAFGGRGVNGSEVDVDMDGDQGGQPMKKSEELKNGMIRPSKEIKAIIDKTAIAVNKSPSPALLEDRIREAQKSDPKFSFLKDTDPFNRYYRYMIELIKEDGEEAALAGGAGKLATSGAFAASLNGGGTPNGLAIEGGATVADGKRQVEENERAERARLERDLEEPRMLEFVNDLGSVTAMDLDILRLTALFTARRGKSFLNALSLREGRNIQFDFLRPAHSLNGYFNRTVAAYTKILQPTPEMLQDLDTHVSDKWATLAEARKRAAWGKIKREKEKKREEEKEAEKKAFAEIDWQDFAMVQTIEFTERDREINLPPPSSIREIMSLGLRERKMAAQIVEEVGEKDQAQLDGGVGGAETMDIEMDMEEEMDEEEEEDEETKERKRKEAAEIARAREIQAKAMGQAGMKIRKDYVSKGLAARPAGKVAMTICPNCKLSIPESEITEHMRIELLDPRWKEQRQLLDQKKTQAAMLMQNADVSASLKQLANARTDLFGTSEDEEARKKQEEEDLKARRAKEAIIYDGHLASRARTLDTYQSRANLDEQINSIHRKAGLLPQDQKATVGPQIGTPGPSVMPPAFAAGAATPDGGIAFSGAVLSAAPQGPSAAPPNFQPSFDPSVYNMPPMPSSAPTPPGIHPSRLAMQMGSASPAPGSPQMPPPFMGSPQPGQIVGQTRPFDAEGATDGPVQKRPKVEKLANGMFYPDHEWIRMHPEPITISVQLPNVPDRPEWKLNGSIIEIPDIPVGFLVSTLRDRIAKVIDAPLPINRMKIDFGPKTLSNSSSLASVNLDEGDVLAMSIRDARKK